MPISTRKNMPKVVPHLYPVEHVGSHVLRTRGQDERRISRVHSGVLYVYVRRRRHDVPIKADAVHLDLSGTVDKLHIGLVQSYQIY